MADTADHLSPEPVLTDTIATPLEGADLQAVQATMSMVTGEVSDGSTDTESSPQASAPATSLPAIPENPDDLLSTPQATAQLQNIITFSNGPSSPVQDDQNFDTPRPSDPEPACAAELPPLGQVYSGPARPPHEVPMQWSRGGPPTGCSACTL